MHGYLTPELGEKNKHPLIRSQWRGRVDIVHKNTTKCFLLLIQMHWKLINTRDAKWTGDHTTKSWFSINHSASVSRVRIYTTAKPHVGVNKLVGNAGFCASVCFKEVWVPQPRSTGKQSIIYPPTSYFICLPPPPSTDYAVNTTPRMRGADNWPSRINTG